MTLRPLVAAMAGALALTVAHARDPIHSATRLAFADAGTLFVADWRGARIHALTVPSPSDVAGEPFNLKDVQGPIARALHAPSAAASLTTDLRTGFRSVWCAWTRRRVGRRS